MKKITAAIISKNMKVFIAKRKAFGRLAGKWEFPGGKIENGETPEECLKRELFEEFEIEVDIGEYVGTSVYQYDFGTIQLIAYKVRVINGDFKLNDHAMTSWTTVDEINNFEFASADLPFVDMISKGKVKI